MARKSGAWDQEEGWVEPCEDMAGRLTSGAGSLTLPPSPRDRNSCGLPAPPRAGVDAWIPGEQVWGDLPVTCVNEHPENCTRWKWVREEQRVRKGTQLQRCGLQELPLVGLCPTSFYPNLSGESLRS